MYCPRCHYGSENFDPAKDTGSRCPQCGTRLHPHAWLKDSPFPAKPEKGKGSGKPNGKTERRRRARELAAKA